MPVLRRVRATSVKDPAWIASTLPSRSTVTARLESGDRKQILEDLMSERDSMYRDVADLIVETDGRKVKAVANEILERL